jgi:hypothetical protein
VRALPLVLQARDHIAVFEHDLPALLAGEFPELRGLVLGVPL